MRSWVPIAVVLAAGCKGQGNGPSGTDRAQASRAATDRFERARAEAEQRQAACLAPVAAALAKIPTETWLERTTIAPADRAALEAATGVDFDPVSHTAAS